MYNISMKRICKHCEKPISHLSQERKYCTLWCKEKHNKIIYCARHKKDRHCSVCEKPYDLMRRARKWTCCDKCETIQSNRAKAKAEGFKTRVGKPIKKCLRCKHPIKNRNYCRDCNIINKALVEFKKEFLK